MKTAPKKDYEIVGTIASNPSTPTSILHDINVTYKDNPYILISLTKNENVPENILNELAGDRNTNVKAAVARNPRTPQHALQKLAESRAAAVIIELASNPSITPQIVNKLVNFSNLTKMTLLRNPDTPADTITEIITENLDNENMLQSKAINCVLAREDVPQWLKTMLELTL